MRCRILFALIFPLLPAVAASTPVSSAFDIAVPMRDGVRLSANVFRPAATGKFPAILLRTPYGKGDAITPAYQFFVNHGYAVIVQDVRGRYRSGGTFEPINQEVNDGDDTLNWIARQPWSDGGVGMYGGSYLGITQWKAAMSRNPHLKAIFPYVSGDDDYRDRFYSTGGAMKIGHRLLWIEENLRAGGFKPPDFASYVQALPVRMAEVIATGHHLAIWHTIANHPSYDEFWKGVSVREHLKDIHIPVFSVGGWYDNYVESDLDAFTIHHKHNPDDRIMIGPWAHVFSAAFSGVNFGKEALVPLRPEQIRWFDRWLKNAPPPQHEHAVRLFVMGINQWRDEDEWPLARARNMKFYLGANGVLGGKPENQAGALDETAGYEKNEFIYDPKKPVPTVGGAVCCDPKIFPWGPLDQRQVERRADVLSYTTTPLGSDLEVTGPIKVVLFVSSSAVDTDFTAKLVDVFPDGKARNLTDGILRMRYRDSLAIPKLMTPGEVYKATIDVGVTSNVFLARHRLRVEISSSNFPRFDRNPNTGGAVADAKEAVKAKQTVYHERQRYSYVLLPVVPSAPAELTSSRSARYVPERASPGQAGSDRPLTAR
ncbi:MAG: CocE/NonD family hydrolase [Acidobacteriota bacterium]|nr:CocE/NonD family hydrolase [Acidobacteriota bacterium]